MDAFKTVVNRYAVYLAVLLLGGPLLLLLLVYAGDIFVAYRGLTNKTRISYAKEFFI
ncbi:hypothetical protein [Bacillus thuringiensis]|uniref:hypothetical protein n=1 Tax=Bacillus thuringiensis TaxID=1428 RepID=UPI0015D5148C|nr:hypothetical protein [Bacillus thuringiensis]